jgi:hypothetical protein
MTTYSENRGVRRQAVNGGVACPRCEYARHPRRKHVRDVDTSAMSVCPRGLIILILIRVHSR